MSLRATILVIGFVLVATFAATVTAIPTVKSSQTVEKNKDVLHSTLRAGEFYQRGLLILCHSNTIPISSSALFTSTIFNTGYNVVAKECTRTAVSGTVGRKTALNHRDVPESEYTGLNFLYEDKYTCSEGEEVQILKTSPSGREVVYTCKAPAEARVIWYGMNLFN